MFNFYKRKSYMNEDVKSLVAKAAEQGMEKYRRETSAQIEHIMSEALQEHAYKVATRSYNVAQKWAKWKEDGPVLWPDRVRMYYRRGDTEVVLQENPPQIRNLRMTGRLSKRVNTGETIDTTIADKVYSYTVALPYINVIFVFKQGLLVKEKTYITFCDRPLKTLSEQPLIPYLSNISDTMSLCHGVSFDAEKLERHNITQQIHYVMDLFWQTVYQDEWASNYWRYREHFQTQDERISNMDAWQANSIENPLFVVEDVDWLHYKEESYGDWIARILSNTDAVDASFQKELFNDISDDFVEAVKESVKEKMRDISQKIKIDFGKIVETI